MNLSKASYWLFGISILFCLELLLASQDKNANGNLIVKNEDIQLKYAYAIAQEGFFDETKEDILVIITDYPLQQEEIEDSFERKKLMEEGKLHGLEVVINSDKNPISATILHNAFKAPPSGRGYEKLELITFSENEIEGNIFTIKINEFFDVAYEYDATFKAKIFREIPPTEDEKNEAANSSQAAIYSSYVKCIMESDFEGLKKLVTPVIADQMSIEDATDMFEFMQMMMPTNVKFLRLTMKGQKSILKMSGEIDNETVSGKSHFKLIDDEWKI
ncbi:MAG: hypothetical protein R3250_15315, partial [Melioribacteraceae bacterium]|nr:hypothetical protein [Melioribacteraceae bacterium]